MVVANIKADNKFEEKYKPVIDIKVIAKPNHKAWTCFNFPSGNGLKQVLLINLSVSDSYHIFKAPAAPAPIATKNNDRVAFITCIWIGAMTKPTNAVNMTRDITLGFMSS